MSNQHPIRSCLVAAVMVIVMAFPAAPASAEPVADADIARLQAQLESLDTAIGSIRDQIADLELMLDEGRTYLVPLPIGGTVMVNPLSRQDALRQWTWLYLDTLPDMDAWTVDGLANFLKEREAESRLVAEAIPKWVEELEERLAQLSRSRAGLEALIAQLQQAATQGWDAGASVGDGASGAVDASVQGDVQRAGSTCVSLKRIVKQGELGQDAKAAMDTKEHSVTSGGDTPRGWRGDFQLNWTAPPKQLCVGETFPVKLVAQNKSPRTDPGLTKAAAVGMTFASGFLSATCDNPQSFDPRSGATVGPDEAEYENSCTIKVDKLVQDGPEKSYVFVSLEAIPKFGNLAYVYE